MNPGDKLAKMVEGLNHAASIADLSVAVEQEKVWNVNKLMASVNKTNQKFTGAFHEVAENVQRIDKNVNINRQTIASTEKKILKKVGGVVDDLQVNMITREELDEAIGKSQLAKDVHFLEKNVTVDERGQCIYSLIIHGIKSDREDREIPPMTIDMVEKHLFSHLGLHNGQVRIISAYRLPKGRNSTKPAPIKIRLETPSQVHLILENLYKLKNVDECRNVHVERDIPMMLSEERKKANAIVWQFRKANGKNYIARVTYPRSKIHIAVKRKGEKEYKALTKDEMDTLYRDSRRSNWGDDDDTDAERDTRRAQGGADRGGTEQNERGRRDKRQRSTPGEKSRAKSAKRASDALFTDDEHDDSFHDIHDDH